MMETKLRKKYRYSEEGERLRKNRERRKINQHAGNRKIKNYR
jgi:hypothetical protein